MAAGVGSRSGQQEWQQELVAGVGSRRGKQERATGVAAGVGSRRGKQEREAGEGNRSGHVIPSMDKVILISTRKEHFYGFSINNLVGKVIRPWQSYVRPLLCGYVCVCVCVCMQCVCTCSVCGGVMCVHACSVCVWCVCMVGMCVVRAV